MLLCFLCLFVAILSPLQQRGACYFLIVEVKRLTSDDLVILVPLPRNQHEVARLRLRDRLVNRLSSIENLPVRLARPLNSLFRVAQYLLRIFRARIVRREYYDVAQAARRFAHRRALRPIAIATTPKDR